MKYKYTLNALTIHEVGQRKDNQGKPHQEDSIYPTADQGPESDGRLFILCDGMGGHDSGEVASQTVCSAMSHAILSSHAPFDDQLLDQALNHAYDQLDQKDNDASSSHKMGTTLTLLMLHAGGATIAHIGDSRVYHIRPTADHQAQLLFSTRDHSLVNDLIKIGSITPEQAKHHPQHNIITRAMQPHQEERCHPDIYHTTDLLPGDYFYLCSDGMLEEMEDTNICNILGDDRSDPDKRATLIKATADNKDNHSAIIVHLLSVEATPDPSPQPATNKTTQPHQEPSTSTDNATPSQQHPKHRLSWLMALLIAAVIAIAIALFANQG